MVVRCVCVVMYIAILVLWVCVYIAMVVRWVCAGEVIAMVVRVRGCVHSHGSAREGMCS